MSDQPDTSQYQLVDPTDPRLNLSSADVSPEEIPSPFIQGVIERMIDLSEGRGGDKHDTRQMVGLAAIQLGVLKKIITIDITADGSLKEQTLRVIINPRITHYSAEKVQGREGCWSCGNICGNVERTKEVTIEGIDNFGNPLQMRLSGFVARIAQHEVDHLSGIRFPDRIPASHPERLHWVTPEQFPAYRKEWSTWPHLCLREKWLSLKAGKNII